MFDFEPGITSPESLPIIQPTHPSIFGHNFDESITNLTIKYPKIPTKNPPLALVRFWWILTMNLKDVWRKQWLSVILLQTLVQVIQHGNLIEVGKHVSDDKACWKYLCWFVESSDNLESRLGRYTHYLKIQFYKTKLGQTLIWLY